MDHDSQVQHEQNASLIVKALLSELDLKVVKLTDNEEFFVAKIKLQEAAETLRVIIHLYIVCINKSTNVCGK